MSELSFADKARIERAVQRVDYSLGGRVPRARRRQIREELRSNLIEATEQVGAEAAVRQLGDLGALSKSYLELYRGRWDFRAGLWAAVITYGAIGALSLAIWMAFSTGVLSGGGHAASYSFGPFVGSASSRGFEFVILSPVHLILMALAFVIGSSYRYVLRR